MYFLKDKQTICNGMSASSLKGPIYSLSFHQSLLLSPFSSYQLLAAYPMSSTDVYFTSKECKRLRSQTDVSSTRQFQPSCYANKNGQLWRDCLDLSVGKSFFFFFLQYIIVVITAEAVGFKQSPEIVRQISPKWSCRPPHPPPLETISWQISIHLLPKMDTLHLWK